MFLINLLDIVNSNTNIILYLEGKRIGICHVCDFPSRHNLNEYYGNIVEEVKSIGNLKLEIYLK